MVGAERFELSTPSPPDWCANQAAPRSDHRRKRPEAGFYSSQFLLSSCRALAGTGAYPYSVPVAFHPSVGALSYVVSWRSRDSRVGLQDDRANVRKDSGVFGGGRRLPSAHRLWRIPAGVRFVGTMPADRWNRASRAERCAPVVCVMQAGKGDIRLSLPASMLCSVGQAEHRDGPRGRHIDPAVSDERR